MVIQLLDGRVVDTEDVSFNASNYHFYWDSGAAGNIDITNTMSRAQKQDNFRNFDPKVDNDRVYVENYVRTHGKAPLPPGSTSTMMLFAQQLYNEPLRAPIEQLNTVINNTGKALSEATGIQTVAVMLAIGAGLYFWATHRR